ncbi:MAG: hypothetical protein ACD_28C00209G0004 [uncultured bacterium]|nr:MAG: hypothetical protein ACD_28C00209G0004 [uncultured bacterium]KKT72620.1 MAG: Ferric uptake regulator, Fur family [Candidatus Peregrinibacteria bacterium GW2011_GWA2_44_7]
MHPASNLVDQLRLQGFRITKKRKALLEVFQESPQPVSALDIDEGLVKKGVNVNKTSIYRELEFLLNEKIIKQIQFNEGKKRYELIGDHHHHLVCEKCQIVEEIKIKPLEDIMPAIEKKLQELKDFTLVDHSLEFFGVCGKCA